MVLADEPTAALDSRSGHEVRRSFSDGRRRNSARRWLSSATTSDWLMLVADRIVELSDGRIVGDRG